MPTRAIFRCQFCDAAPDHGTHRSLQGQVTERMFGEYLDAFPGRWLVWNGGGPLGPRRYACRKHRGDLVAYLRYHYATVAAQVWKMPPYEQRWPDEKRPHMGGSMGIIKFGLRGGLLQDSPPAQAAADAAKGREAAAAAPADPSAAEPTAPAPEVPATAPDEDDRFSLEDMFPPGELYLPEELFPSHGEDPPPWPGGSEPWPGGGEQWPEPPPEPPPAP